MTEIFCQECEGTRIDVDICGCCERDCYMCGGSGLSGEALAWCRAAERPVKVRRLDTDPPLLFHTVQLGFEEVLRRWPARTAEQRRAYGFDPLAAQDQGWHVCGTVFHTVQKQLACSGAGCPLCDNSIPPDQIP